MLHSNLYNDQFIKSGGSGVNEYPPLVTTTRPARPTNNQITEENVESTDNKTYHSSEYVNEVRYPAPQRTPGVPHSEETEQTDQPDIFTPTTRPSLSEDSSEDRQSSEDAKLDLHHFLDHHFEDEDKAHIKRKSQNSIQSPILQNGKQPL